MKEKYNIVISERQAVPRSKRMREAGQAASSSAIVVSGTSGGSSGDGHSHTNLPVLERLGLGENDEKYLTIRVGEVNEETGELIVTHEKVKAGYADKAHELDEDSPVNEKFLRKDQADGTDFRLTVGGLTSKELIEANNGLVVRRSEVVEPAILSLLSSGFEDSLVEENADAFIEELRSSSGNSSTLGELDNVAAEADSVSETSDLLVRPAGSLEWTLNTTLISQVSALMAKVFPFTISFTGGGVYEKGSVQTINLSWTYDRDIMSQSINGETLDIGVRAKQYTDVISDTTYNLSAIYEGHTYSKSTSVEFRLKKYYGVSAQETLINEDILALNSLWATRAQSSTVFDCTGGKYPYYVIPTSMVAGIQFWIGGLRNTDWQEEVRAVTNAYGYTESYTVFRLNRIQTGVLNIEVK